MKQLKRGDRVKFLNDVGTGTVTRLIDNEMVMVRTDDGFEYPVLNSELISSVIDESETREEPESIEKVNSVVVDDLGGRDNKGKNQDVSGPVILFLAIVPIDNSEPVGGEADIFLINDSDFNILYHCWVRISHKVINTIAAGNLDPDTKLLIGTMHLDDLFGDKSGMSISIIPFGYGKQPYTVPITQTISPGREFIAGRSAYTENDYTEEDAFLIRITGTDKDRENESADLILMLRESMSSEDIVKDSGREENSQAVKKIKASIEEVDLHIGEIVDSTAGLMSGDILKIQVDRFRTSLDGALLARQNKIVYIHGSGEGKLKHEIRRIIDREYPRCRYQDASFKEYGYGATMVLIK